MIQISYFSLEAELWKILRIAQISPASISTPSTLLYPKFIIDRVLSSNAAVANV